MSGWLVRKKYGRRAIEQLKRIDSGVVKIPLTRHADRVGEPQFAGEFGGDVRGVPLADPDSPDFERI